MFDQEQKGEELNKGIMHLNAILSRLEEAYSGPVRGCLILLQEDPNSDEHVQTKLVHTEHVLGLEYFTRLLSAEKEDIPTKRHTEAQMQIARKLLNDLSSKYMAGALFHGSYADTKGMQALQTFGELEDKIQLAVNLGIMSIKEQVRDRMHKEGDAE